MLVKRVRAAKMRKMFSFIVCFLCYGCHCAGGVFERSEMPEAISLFRSGLPRHSERLSQ
jgi:hypothetical protein